VSELLYSSPRTRGPPLRPEVTTARSLAILAVLGILGGLYLAKQILVPLAIAVLLTFILAPLVRLLAGWLGRVPSVAVVVLGAGLIIFGLGSFLGQQLTDLAKQLPQYQYVIQGKIQALSTATSGGAWERLSGLLERLNRQLTTKEASKANTESPSGTGPAPPPPIPVEIHQPEPTPIESMERLLPPLLDPLAMTGIVIVFVVFFLLRLPDLRARLIKVAGSHDLKRTTEALDDAARRLSRYFLAQTGLNALFGVLVAVGLALIGVPNPMLWGLSAIVLRFVPYIGAVIAAAFPTALAIAVGPDWSMTFWTVGLFVVIEPLIGQVLEPLVYGHSTGLSPVAVILAATFWTWLWGPIGLLLSTPITVCLGVLGRHIGWLEFIDVLVGGDAPLTPAQTFYQRALARDFDEITDQAEQLLKTTSLIDYCDEVVLRGLVLAEIDFTRGLLDHSHIQNINEALQELTEELSNYENPVAKKAAKRSPSIGRSGKPEAAGREPVSSTPKDDRRVACLWGRGPFDKALAAVLAHLLERNGLGAQLDATEDSSVARLGHAELRAICLSSLAIGRSSAQIRHYVRRFRHQSGRPKTVLCLWGHDVADLRRIGSRIALDCDCHAASFKEAIACLLSPRSTDEPERQTGSAVDAA
jgi:predicted PurR-regulated permease PerM